MCNFRLFSVFRCYKRQMVMLQLRYQGGERGPYVPKGYSLTAIVTNLGIG